MFWILRKIIRPTIIKLVGKPLEYPYQIFCLQNFEFDFPFLSLCCWTRENSEVTWDLMITNNERIIKKYNIVHFVVHALVHFHFSPFSLFGGGLGTNTKPYNYAVSIKKLPCFCAACKIKYVYGSWIFSLSKLTLDKNIFNR